MEDLPVYGEKYGGKYMNHRFQRNSGIELLKIISICIIIITHITQTNLLYIGPNLSVGDMDIQHLILMLFRHFGVVGNLVFFISSAWFLIEKKVSNKQKVVHMVMDIWVISVMFLMIPVFTHADYLSFKVVIKSLLPLTFENNWFMTCYILFYLAFPFLNIIIEKVSRKTHLRMALVLTFLYIVVNNVIKNRYYYSELVLWVSIYFIIAYMRKYRPDFSKSVKLNIGISVVSMIAFVLQIFGTYYAASKLHLSDGWLLHWNVMENPIVILLALSLVNLASNAEFKSAFINYISGCTLLIYVFHENIIFREHYRKYMWLFIYQHFQPHQLWAWALLLSAVLFVAAVLVSLLYRLTLQRLTQKFSELLYRFVRKNYLKAENKLLKIKSDD